MSRFRDFKNFYNGLLKFYHKDCFPKLPSYERFVHLMTRAILPLTIFTQIKAVRQTGGCYIDSSCLPVCHLKRSKRYKTFDSIAEYGKTSVGWFFDLKLHIVTNDLSEFLAFKITRGTRSDSQEIDDFPFLAIPLNTRLEEALLIWQKSIVVASTK
jgi:hypothetical protein